MGLSKRFGKRHVLRGGEAAKDFNRTQRQVSSDPNFLGSIGSHDVVLVEQTLAAPGHVQNILLSTSFFQVEI
jgi:hypothetical protein